MSQPLPLTGIRVIDVATVIATMHALREHAHSTDFVLLGDSKLLSEPKIQALLAAGVGYLAPLPRTRDLDAAFLAIPPEQLGALDYVSVREAGKPPQERTTYHGMPARWWSWVRDGAGGARPHELQRVFILSSEERAACRRNRVRQRERAEARSGASSGEWEPPYPTAARARAKIEAILEQRHLAGLYRVSSEEHDGRPTVSCELVTEALARAEALDGYYVLETTRPATEADASALLSEWKGQWQIEQRHRSAKGPLRIRPLFVTSNQRIVGLITILGIALMVFSLIEREARRTLGAG
jgi:transposase